MYSTRAIIPLFKLLSVAFLCLTGQQAISQSCSGTLGDPIVNQTFGSGANPGPSIGSLTNYPYSSDTCPSDGTYTIRNSTNIGSTAAPAGCFLNWWHVTSDHTGDPNGYMMLVGASTTIGQFYSQTISGLCDNTTYEFSSWVMNLLRPGFCTSNPNRFPNLTFRIETTSGTLLQTFSTGNVPVTTDPTWNRYATFFTTTAGTNTVVLKLINNAPGGCGNDLALDDIQFRACGPSLSISPSASSICSGQSVNLTSSLSAGYNSPAFQWQQSTDNTTWTDIDGATGTTLNQTPATSGTRYYRLLASETGNITSSTCRIASNSVSVTVNTFPVAAASGGCSGTSPNTTIDLVAADAGNGATYTWTGPLNYTAVSTTTTTSFAYTATTQNGTYDLTVTKDGCTATSSVNIQCTTPLPVTLMRFTGRQVEKTVVLSWATSQESNASHYEVMRSTDARSFEGSGRVNAQGNSSNVLNYSWIDNAPAQGLNYYRMRMVDQDGRSELSRIVSVRFANDAKTVVVVNPAEADGRVLVITDVTDPHFTFANLAGRSLPITLLDHSQNRYWLLIDRPNDLRMGLLQVQSKEGVYTQKVLFP